MVNIEGATEAVMVDLKELCRNAQLMRELNLTPGVVHRVTTALSINNQGRDSLDHTRAELILKWISPQTHEDAAFLLQATQEIARNRS